MKFGAWNLNLGSSHQEPVSVDLFTGDCFLNLGIRKDNATKIAPREISKMMFVLAGRIVISINRTLSSTARIINIDSIF